MKKLRNTMQSLLGIFLALTLFTTASLAADPELKKESPWLLTPTVSSDPKLGTSVGGLVGYLVKFDEDSPTSMFGVSGSYSSTESSVYGIFAQTYFGEDRHRLVGFYGGGRIENEYQDFLGSGARVLSQDNLEAFGARYLRRVRPHLYLGLQYLDANYAVTGKDPASQAILDLVGLFGFDSTALGLVIQYDDRDNTNSPAQGSLLTLHNTAFRKGLGGDESFDAYMADLRHYIRHHDSKVLALRLNGRWSVDAPSGGKSSVTLRGYTRGQYLNDHITSFEVDERIPLKGKWTMNLYAGLAGLYSNFGDLKDSGNWFPALAGGVGYTLKEEEKIVVRLDAALGREGNKALYLSFGHPF